MIDGGMTAEEQQDKQVRDLAERQRIGKEWMARIRAQEKASESWRKDAQDAENAYMVSEEGAATPHYNILHSNVETIVPATYNSTPSPDIRPRHNVKDDAAKLVCDIYERAISSQIDDEALDTEIEGTAQDSFLAGRGITRVKYEADMDGEILNGERVIYENVSWRDYREGPAKRWRDVPWVAYREHVYQDKLDQMWDMDVSTQDQNEDSADDEGRKGGIDLWQIWDKDSRQVITIAADKSEVIRFDDDPLGLPGFFPQPEPIQPIKVTGRRTPICPYSVYRALAKELDTQTKRIGKITAGLKVRGLFAGDANVMAAIRDAEDNSLVSVPELNGMASTTKFEDTIAWWPVDKAIVVLRELMAQREGTKQAIYEITGISDIVRGASKSSETATAQQIKTQWGSLRIKRSQNLIARHVRDLFVLTAEVMAKNFEPLSILNASGVSLDLPQPELPPMPQFPQGTPPEIMQQVGAEHSRMVTRIKQEHQEAQARHTQAVYDGITSLDHYRIDIESDSTVRADLTQKRGEMATFLQSTAQFFQTMAPIVQESPQAAGPIIEMYSSFARQFSLGKQAEDALDQMVEMSRDIRPGKQEQPQPDPVKMKALEIKQSELGLKKQAVDIDGFRAQKDAEHKQAEIMLEADQRRPVGIG